MPATGSGRQAAHHVAVALTCAVLPCSPAIERHHWGGGQYALRIPAGHDSELLHSNEHSLFELTRAGEDINNNNKV